MPKKFLTPFLIGLGVIALAIAGVFYMQRGAHVQIQGGILKVRTLEMADGSSIAVVDFRFVNPSDYPFVVQRVEVEAEAADGRILEGATVAEVDAKKLFEYYPVLGQKFNETLLPRDRVPSRQNWDRMVAARFEMPEAALQSRKNLLIHVTEVDGAVSTIREKP
ncbi:MAG: hypothetical protein IT158_08800 [Bryobacterales bacterium]|nr:hypothetical protein [Bryobacterales bacterium]